jgi:cold shock CspA family protein
MDIYIIFSWKKKEKRNLKRKEMDIEINYKKINMTEKEGDVSAETYMGVVKWFNNKTGYGFITCLEKEYQHKDIFVHHSALTPYNDQYKYLIQGEYVQFQIKHQQHNTHSISANNVTGILGGNILIFNRAQPPRKKPFPI